MAKTGITRRQLLQGAVGAGGLRAVGGYGVVRAQVGSAARVGGTASRYRLRQLSAIAPSL